MILYPVHPQPFPSFQVRWAAGDGALYEADAVAQSQQRLLRPCRECDPGPLDAWNGYQMSWHILGIYSYPLVNIQKNDGKSPCYSWEKSTISTGPFSSSQTVNVYQRVLRGLSLESNEM